MSVEHVWDEIPVVQGPTLRDGTQIVAGVITAGQLVDRYVIPRRDFRKKSGYQRDASTARVNRLASELAAGRVDLPTALLMNMRDFDASKHLVRRNGSLFLRVGDAPLYMVDGQHRVEALKKLATDDPNSWEDFQIPFVCMLGANELQEMEQFYVVNSTAKSVRTDLALDLLKQRAEADPKIMEGLIETGDSWKVKAQTLVERLEKASPVWQGRIRFPGEPKAATTISSSGMAASMKQLLGTPYFGSITTDNQLKVLNAYWSGVRHVIPEAFDDPTEYAIQKSTGVMVFHALLVNVIEVIRSNGSSVIDPESYARILEEPLVGLEGDSGLGVPVQGADFWKSGIEGAAGSFSSNAGRRVLVAKLKAMLPSPEVE